MPTSYTSPTVLSVHSYLLPSSNSKILIIRAKLSKISKFCPLVKTVIEIKKLYSTHQHESRDMLDFQNGAPGSQVITIS